MRTETKTEGATRRKGISAAKQALLSFSLLIILLAVGYFFYGGNENSPAPDDSNKVHSAPAVQERQKPDKSEDISVRITKAKLQLESVDNVDRIRVIVPEDRGVKHNITYKYEWFKNGSPYGANEDNITGFKKGDKIDVKITPYESEKNGQSVLLTMTIERVSPQIVENKTLDFDGKTLTYQVKAIDPNGGPLSYSLVSAPKDMTIDSATGMINWPVKPHERGKHTVNVMIKSSSGGEVVYPFSIDMAKLNQ